LKYDLHVHSKYSRDGFLNPKMIIKTAQKRGLSGVAITDHNTIQGGLIAKKFETEDLHVIVGSEIDTDRGEVLGLFLNEEIKSRMFSDVVKEIKDQNGLVIAPHPFDEIRGNGINPQKDDIPFIDCIEIYNSRCLLEKYNLKARKFSVENKLKISAGSDAHFANEIGKAGLVVQEKIVNPEDLFENNLSYFGEKSNIFNLGLTKLLEIWKHKNF